MIAFEVVIQEFLAQAIVDVFLVRIVLVVHVMTPERIVECKRLLLNNFT
jgi:hypothetical protein